MIRDHVSLFLSIEDAYDSIRLNLDCLSYLSMGLSMEPDDKGTHSILRHLIHLCEQDTTSLLAEMEAAISELKPLLMETTNPPFHPPDQFSAA
jgi:hypothetical protein